MTDMSGYTVISTNCRDLSKNIKSFTPYLLGIDVILKPFLTQFTEVTLCIWHRIWNNSEGSGAVVIIKHVYVSAGKCMTIYTKWDKVYNKLHGFSGQFFLPNELRSNPVIFTEIKTLIFELLTWDHIWIRLYRL